MASNKRPARIQQCHSVFSKIMILMGMLYWFQTFHFNVANAFYTSQIMTARQTIGRTRRRASSSSYHRLYGISEWRAKFSSIPSNSSQTIINNDSLDSSSSSTPTAKTSSLPLLLLPFTPTQILLPGQSTTLKFRHGKYIDMIDESLTSYESVVGMSILDEDGLLPYVVICEVLGDEMEMNMGSRGFSSMEVGVRAVGRARRIGVGEEKLGRSSSSSSLENANSFRGRTALDDIHLGQFVEWQDNALDDDEFERASEYLGNIESLLMLSSNAAATRDKPPDIDDRIHRQQILFTNAYETTLEQLAANPSPNMSTYSNSQRLRHARLMASSWATLAITEGRDSRSSAIIMHALSTKDTVDRLRLGLAMMLDSQIPIQDTVGEMKGQDNTFQ
mmetsp:Transcript_28036/g.59806  ORF Transcript_28036/g.59806 Transcript_28036/m.59806 type:complete len:390 (+) Transcript_28036:349-1518(+)|eukprot:CAMPEP_0172306958 /NCGR_PEP_ID=MMETSP1058-20130122/7913_1 /TAXON_ID=83371 /ORGANISM="Detonula confervacea, Strain CCMP 353" /LENGTH=389 /DNA_ID=CAMNT_0013019011 /DNA_START=362 /DNA_END=1531 /DNA_ORIENTATION=-